MTTGRINQVATRSEQVHQGSNIRRAHSSMCSCTPARPTQHHHQGEPRCQHRITPTSPQRTATVPTAPPFHPQHLSSSAHRIPHSAPVSSCSHTLPASIQPSPHFGLARTPALQRAPERTTSKGRTPRLHATRSHSTALDTPPSRTNFPIHHSSTREYTPHSTLMNLAQAHCPDLLPLPHVPAQHSAQPRLPPQNACQHSRSTALLHQSNTKPSSHPHQLHPMAHTAHSTIPWLAPRNRTAHRPQPHSTANTASHHTLPAPVHATAPHAAPPPRPPEAGLQASPPHRNPRQGRLSCLVTKGATPQYSRSHGQPKRSTPQHTTLAAHVIAFLQMTSPDCATCCVTPRLVATCYFPAAPRPIKSI